MIQAPAGDYLISLDYRQFWRNSFVVGALVQVFAAAEDQDVDAAFTAGIIQLVDSLIAQVA